MQIRALASGSSGNSILIRSETTAVLIDAGITCRRICAELKDTGMDPAELKALLITHEHSDHISGLPVLLRHYAIPVYASPETLAELRKKMPGVPENLFHEVLPLNCFEVGDLRICPMRTFHDAAGPLAYRVDSGDSSAAVLTDTGCCPDELLGSLRGLSALLLESNHDVRMLEAGSYPYPLKRRILGDYGHLSNEAAASVLSSLISGRLRLVLLGHISEENNYPEIALMTAREAIEAAPPEKRAPDLELHTLSRHQASPVYEF